MNFIKYFICLLLIIIKIDCSPYNHLDIQLSLLILSAGDINGNILYDPTLINENGKEERKYLSINIGKNGKLIRSIVDIIPSLKAITKEGLDPDVEKQKIEEKFRELYIKAEKIACDRLGHEFISDKRLSSNYKENLEVLRAQYKNKFENLDIFRELNDEDINLINGNSEVTTLSFYQVNTENHNRNLSKRIAKENNENFISYIVDKSDEFSLINNERKESKSNIATNFETVAKACNSNTDCKEMFLDSNNQANYNTKYNLIRKEKNKNDPGSEEEFYLSIIKDNEIKTFHIKSNGKEYEVSNIKEKVIDDEEDENSINSKLKGYGKVRKAQFEVISNLLTINLLEKIYPVNSNVGTPNNEEYYKFNTIMNDGPHFTEYDYASKLCNKASSVSNRNKYLNCKTEKGKFKRSDSTSCKLGNTLKVKKEININSSTINILKMFKNMNLNSKILPYNINIENIDHEKLLYKDSNSIDEVWNEIVNTYINNIKFFDENQSKYFIRNFSDVINNYITVLIDSDYENVNIKIDENKFSKILSLYYKVIDIHKENFNDIDYNININDLDNFESQSKISKNKLKNSINRICDIVGVDAKSILESDDPSVINDLCDKISNTDIDDVDGIDDLLEELNNIKIANDIYLYKNDEASINSEIVEKLYNSIATKYDIEIEDQKII